eukprot:4068204-Pyramimonas_sp.AAC.1
MKDAYLVGTKDEHRSYFQYCQRIYAVLSTNLCALCAKGRYPGTPKSCLLVSRGRTKSAERNPPLPLRSKFFVALNIAPVRPPGGLLYSDRQGAFYIEPGLYADADVCAYVSLLRIFLRRKPGQFTT